MSCIVSERGTRVSKPIFHVFCTRKIFFHFLGIIASLASARSREIPANPIGEKSDFCDFSELHQVPYGTPKMTPEKPKMIQTSTHNTFLAHLSIRLPSPSWGLPLRCLWARIRNGQRAPKTAPQGHSTTPGSP